MPTGDLANAGLAKPAFVFSIDTELMWGSFLRTSAEEFAAEFGDLRATIRRLLDLLDRHRIPSTWAIVGHLMLGSCTRDGDGLAHPDISRPQYGWLAEDWYAHDPCASAGSEPLWYAPEVIDMIRGAQVAHEIASHSFGHIIFGDPGCPPAAARDDLRAWSAAAAGHGVTGASIVFPRNRPGHLDVVAESGYLAYRARPAQSPLRLLPRLNAAAGEILARPSMPSGPRFTPEGLVEIPASMPFMLPRGRLRKVVPVRARVAKARRGVTTTVRRGGVFHLWLHPMDLAADPQPRFEGLERVFRHVAECRDTARLDVLTMGEMATVFHSQADARG
jgi:peptidoglycan/xylan/chitin deacetylase (PgdA/CDA1 family)